MKASEWIVGAAVAALVVGIPIILAGHLVPSDWKKPEVIAAWIQAIGSVVAIAAGAAVVWWQMRHQRQEQTRLRLEEEIRRLQLLWSLIYHSRAMMAFVASVAGKGGFRDALPMRQYMAALRAVNVVEVPDPQAAVAVVMATQTYDMFERYGAPLADDSTREKEYREHLAVALQNLTGDELALRRCLQARGADIMLVSPVVAAGIVYPPAELS